MRRALLAGMSRETLIWNTDERLLFQMEHIKESQTTVDAPPLQELVQRYRLLEAPLKIAQVELEDDATLKTIGLPQSVAWIEQHLSTSYFQPIVTVVRARHGRNVRTSTLFPPPAGLLLIFKLGGPPKELYLPNWLRCSSKNKVDLDNQVSVKELSRRLATRIKDWSKEKPWNSYTKPRVHDVTSNLQNYGDWSFRLSRNTSLHSYPGTFVHAIPAALIKALGVQGDIIVDPFGGTGQTTAEAVRLGCQGVSGDVNFVACLAARARLTYLGSRSRDRIREVDKADINSCEPSSLPDFANRDKWFHPDTLIEIGMLKTYIQRRRDPVAKQFLLACLSAMLTSCTGRRGKEHGYFADNTPLEKGKDAPPYQNAVEEFLLRINRNLEIIERLYVQIERDGDDPEKVLDRAKVIRTNVSTSKPEDYGLDYNSAGAIITSPPYLCMADYTLGQRLSYELLHPNEIENDFSAEIGKRRQRFQGEKAKQDYLEGLKYFVTLSSDLLRVGGYVATVLGSPTAIKFKGWDSMKELDILFAEKGFEKIWETWRPINWHRNHGYARLSQERIAVHIFRGN